MMRLVLVALHRRFRSSRRCELRVVADGLVRQVVKKAVAAGKLFGDMLHELLVAAFGVRSRRLLAVIGDVWCVRKPNAEEDRKRFRQKLEVALAASYRATESVQAPQDERGVACAIEVLPDGG
jgi:hypothetical protein